jgi:glycosyltransferase involved in cell wall biosynthesis
MTDPVGGGSGTEGDPIDLSVVIPMHNSASVIESTVRAWKDYLTSGRTELILVENGSRDATWEVAQRLADPTDHVEIRLLRSAKGMGNALRAGILASAGRRVLLSADDLPFGFDDLANAPIHGADARVVIGSKAHRESRIRRSLARQVFTIGFRGMRFLVLGSRIGDTQGTFLVEGDLLRAYAPELDERGFLFTTQFAVFAERDGVSIAEIPVTLRRAVIAKESTVRLSDIGDMGRGLWRLRRSLRRHRRYGIPREVHG